MKKFLLLCFLLSGTYCFSQDTIYLDKKYKPVSKASAEYFRVLERNPANPDSGWERTYFICDQIKVEKYYRSFEQEILDGKRKVWRNDGSLWTESDYQNGKLDGFFISYWQDGQLKRQDIYEKGNWKSGKTWDENGDEVEWYAMEIRPVFPGGKKGLKKYLVNSVKRPKNVDGGRVVVEFVIDIDGSIMNVSVKESTNAALNLAAYNVVANMPSWEPGRQDGNAVRVIHTIPLNFPK